MSAQTVLVVGGTGRTGRRVLEGLLGRGVRVRAIVRSREKLPAGAAGDPGLTVVEAGLLALSDEELRGHVRGCDAVVSCLGHVLSFRGVFGAPRDLVRQATARLCRAIEASRPATPTRVVLMSSVSVHLPRGLDARRGGLERAYVWALRALLPPARDNQRAADFLRDEIGASHPFVQWAVVRPDTLLEGDLSEYTLHEGLVASLFAPRSTRMASVAHFICELATSPEAWSRWAGKMPVIVDARAAGSAPAPRGR